VTAFITLNGIEQGGGGGGGSADWGTAVQTLVALRAVAAAARADKQLRLVEDAQAIYRFDTAGLGADDNDLIIVPNDIVPPAPGRWFKIAPATAPAPHKVSHQNGGADQVSIAGLTGESATAQPPKAHKANHEPGGGDAMAVDAAAATGSLRTLGNGAQQACGGDDARLSDARTPTAHKASHESGGGDALALGSIAGTISDAQHGSRGGGALHALATPDPAGAAGFLSAADKQKLDGVTVFGKDYQTAISTARSTTTSSTYQTKTTLTTPALTGTYRVAWAAVVDNGGANGKSRLYNSTDAAVVGAERVFKAGDSAERQTQSGFAEIVFTGAAKTFQLQYGDVAGGNTQGIQDARIELWRVS